MDGGVVNRCANSHEARQFNFGFREAIAKVALLWDARALFPLTLPFSSGRGSIVGSAFENPIGLELS